MGSARGRANHALYMARLVLAAWRRDAAEESVPAVSLSQAFLPAVRDHLQQAYGWFLLEILRPEPMPAVPPRTCAALPGIAAGKALPGEIREFAQLEATGWLAGLLATGDLQVTGNAPDNLAAGPAFITPAEAAGWADALQVQFERMADSLDEY